MKPTKIVKELDKEQGITYTVTITDYHKSPNNPVVPYDTDVEVITYKRKNTPKDYHAWVKRYYKQYEDRKDWYYTRKYPKLVYKGQRVKGVSKKITRYLKEKKAFWLTVVEKNKIEYRWWIDSFGHICQVDTDQKFLGVGILGYRYKGQIHLTQVLDLFTTTEGTKVSMEKILKLLKPIKSEPVKRRRSISRGRI
tara:strand:- start:1216 stop:1800 length:585 start_codon:yes stop_codon:yes gene_type:complete